MQLLYQCDLEAEQCVMHPNFVQYTFPFCLSEKMKMLKKNQFEKIIKSEEIFTPDIVLDEAIYDDGRDDHGGVHARDDHGGDGVHARDPGMVVGIFSENRLISYFNQ